MSLIKFGARQTKKGVSAKAWGKRKIYRGAFIGGGRNSGKRLVFKKLKDNPNLQFPDFKNDYGLQKLIRLSGLPEDKYPKDSTLQKWLRETRKKVKAKPKRGARKKTK